MTEQHQEQRYVVAWYIEDLLLKPIIKPWFGCKLEDISETMHNEHLAHEEWMKNKCIESRLGSIYSTACFKTVLVNSYVVYLVDSSEYEIVFVVDEVTPDLIENLRNIFKYSKKPGKNDDEDKKENNDKYKCTCSAIFKWDGTQVFNSVLDYQEDDLPERDQNIICDSFKWLKSKYTFEEPKYLDITVFIEDFDFLFEIDDNPPEHYVESSDEIPDLDLPYQDYRFGKSTIIRAPERALKYEWKEPNNLATIELTFYTGLMNIVIRKLNKDDFHHRLLVIKEPESSAYCCKIKEKDAYYISFRIPETWDSSEVEIYYGV